LAWAVPLWSQETLAGVLFLGDKRTGGPYSEEEIELAQAGGERLLDRLAGAEVVRLSLELLRQRLTEARVLEGQGRRVLHDEVLPELHTALLYLSADKAPNQDAVEMLSQAHRRISDLLHSGAAAGAPDRLAQAGLIGALRALLENDFAAEFERVDWEVDPQAQSQSLGLQPFAAETAYYAARELVRNAAKYARGGDSGRKIVLEVRLTGKKERLSLEICDNGVGPHEPLDGNGAGLRIHSALLAAAGGSLEVSRAGSGGTRGVITI
jgi:two-component sensor histidine kinase